MKFLAVAIIYCFTTIVVADTTIRTPRRMDRRHNHLYRRTPMKKFMQNLGGKKKSESQSGPQKSIQLPLLQAQHSNSAGDLSQPHAKVKMTVTAPAKASGRGVSVERTEGTKPTERFSAFSDKIRSNKNLKPHAPGAKEKFSASHPSKAKLDAATGWDAQSAGISGEATGKRVNVNMLLRNSDVGTIRKKQSDGQWGPQQRVTSADVHPILGTMKQRFSNPDGSPVTVEASTAGGNLKMSAKNYPKGPKVDKTAPRETYLT